jgi:hypothetical protein
LKFTINLNNEIIKFPDGRRSRTMDRKAIATAVAKVIAYKNCNKPEMAQEWFVILARELGMSIPAEPTKEETEG